MQDMLDINYLSYLVITGVVMIIGLFLKNWHPPIKKQYIALILLPLGALMGYLKVQNPYYGFLIAGLVYYKDELVSEVLSVTDSFQAIKKVKSNNE